MNNSSHSLLQFSKSELFKVYVKCIENFPNAIKVLTSSLANKPSFQRFDEVKLQINYLNTFSCNILVHFNYITILDEFNFKLLKD